MHARARYIATDSFEYWHRHQDYVPTARRSRWPRSWGSYRHLRFLLPPNVAPIPKDLAERTRLENLHEAVRKKRFYDPNLYERTTGTARGCTDWYVTLIPRPVVEWFERHSLAEVNSQIATVVALHVIEARPDSDDDPTDRLLEAVHASYHPAIRERIAAYDTRYPALRWNEDLDPWTYEEDSQDAYFEALQAVTGEHHQAGDLPCWLFRSEAVERPFGGPTSIFSQLCPLPGPPEPWSGPYKMPWETPTQYEPGLGIVGFGLTERDRLRLDGKEPTQDGRAVRIPSARIPKEQANTLQRTEADAEAFEFLVYAKSVRKSWAPWRID